MQQWKDIRVFKGAKLNLDASVEELQPNEILDARNMIPFEGCMINMKGFESVMQMPVNSGFTLPPGNFKNIGTVRDIQGKSLIYFLCDVTEDKLPVYVLRLFAPNFSGDTSGFEILTSAGTYAFCFECDPTTTPYTIFNSMWMYYPGSTTKVYDFDTPHFTLTYQLGEIYVISKVDSISFVMYEAACFDAVSEGLSGTNHSILRMSTDTYVLDWILKGESVLNFQPDHTIRAWILGGMLGFNDGYEGTAFVDFNPPRKVNIAKAAKYTDRFYNYPRMDVVNVGKANTLLGVSHYVNSSGQEYIGYQCNPTKVFDDGDQVVAFVFDDGVIKQHHKTSTGFGNIVGIVDSGGFYYVITDRVWTDTVNDTLILSGHILAYETGMYFGIDFQVLDMAKYPPSDPPSVSYDSDTDFDHNNLRNDLFQFATRFVYDDNEKSVFCTPSDVPLPTRIEYPLIFPDSESTIDNRINVWYDTGSLEVKAVEVCVRRGNTGTWVLVHREYKYDQAGELLLTSDVSHPFYFYNNELGEPLDQNDANRIQDFVPQIARHWDVIEKNRLLYGRYTEGFDNCEIDMVLTAQHIEADVGRLYSRISQVTSYRKYFGKYWISLLGGDGHASFWGAYINFFQTVDGVTFFEEGFTYIIRISFLPATYYWPSQVNQDAIYGEYSGVAINSSATVRVEPGMTFSDFSRLVVSQLRTGIGGSGRVIGLDNYYNLFHNFNQLYDYERGESSPLVPDGHIGFIIEVSSLGITPQWVDCNYCQFANIDIQKVKQSQTLPTFSAGWQPFGIVYEDYAGRRSMVNRSDNSKVLIPAQNEHGYSHLVYQNKVKFEINHIPPVEAVKYHIVYMGNASMIYSLYASIASIENSAKSDKTINCTIIYVNEYIVQTSNLINRFQVNAYSWELGDRIRFVFNRNRSSNLYYSIEPTLDFEILGVYYSEGDAGYKKDESENPEFIFDEKGNKVRDPYGSAILVNKFDFESYNIEDDFTIVEIYRPKKQSDNGEYFDIGEPLPILEPHTENRRHGGYIIDQITDGSNGNSLRAAYGIIEKGDAYLALRTMYNAFPCERPNYSDFFDSECYWKGKPNVPFANARRQEYIARLLYTQRYVQNTLVNGLSTVYASDFFDLPEKFGGLNFLKDVGNYVQLLQENMGHTLLVGRAGITQSTETGTEIMTSTKDVLGTLYTHKFNYGTIHPESVSSFGDRMWFWDHLSNEIIRDAGNGQQALSTTYNIRKLLLEEIPKFGLWDNLTVISAYDQQNEIVFFTFIDKTTAANSFTLAFKDNPGRNEDGFIGKFDFIPDFYGTAEKIITSFKGNELWLQNSDNAPRCNFYGVQYDYWVKVVSNANPLEIKRWLSLYLSSNFTFSCPDAGDIEILPSGNNPSGMSSMLPEQAFNPIQGKFVADFAKNMRSNQEEATTTDLVEGEDLAGQAMAVRLEGSKIVEHKLFVVEFQGVTSKI